MNMWFFSFFPFGAQSTWHRSSRWDKTCVCIYVMVRVCVHETGVKIKFRNTFFHMHLMNKQKKISSGKSTPTLPLQLALSSNEEWRWKSWPSSIYKSHITAQFRGSHLGTFPECFFPSLLLLLLSLSLSLFYIYKYVYYIAHYLPNSA